MSSDTIAALRQGRDAMRAGRLQVAAEHFGEAIVRNPKAALPWSLQAEVLYRLGRLRDAKAAARRAVQLDEEATLAWVRLGIIGLRQGDLQESARNFETALSVDPVRAAEWHRRLTGHEEGASLSAKEPASIPELVFAELGRDLALEEDSGELQIQRRRAAEDASVPLWDVGHFIRGRHEVLAVRRGGMSFVHICFDHLQGRPYAVKALKRELLDLPGIREAFLREAELWVSLERHPNIVEADFVQVIDNQPAIFLEYVDGGSVAGLLRERPLPVVKAVELALQVCYALQHAHLTAKIIHRDIKPSNILLTKSGIAKVTDFGLAHAVGEAQFSDERARHRVYGTPQYMAPEQFTPDAEVTVRADIYAFGCTLYEMLTRQWPFKATTPSEFKAKHESEIAPDPRTYNQALRPELVAIVTKCLAKSEVDRYRSFMEVSTALGEVYVQLTGTARTRPAVVSGMSAEQWVAKGASLAQLGKLEESLEAFDRAIQLDQELPQAWTGKAESLRTLGRYREALVCCYRALSRDPRSLVAYNIRGLCYAALGEHDRALEDFDRAIAIDPNQREVWHNRGLSLEAKGNYDGAIECFDRVLAFEPRTPQSLLSKALCLLAKGDYQAAVEVCELLLEIDPDSAAAWKVKGAALAALQKWGLAVTCYEKALEIAPEDEYARQAAEEARQQSIQKSPAHAESSFERGIRRFNRGRFAEAVAEFERAVQEDPGDERAWRYLSATLFRLGRYAEAESPARKSIELKPDDPAALCNLGVILRKQERWSEAREVLKAALRLDANYLKARIELDKVNIRDPSATRQLGDEAG
ncbi:MAG: tetratricopeptide repeat protein [Candidatus Zipacnadales bacterium]